MPPESPYWAVIFSSRLSQDDHGYEEMAKQMVDLASRQPGFLGVESARGNDRFGITVSYWKDQEAIAAWKTDLDHRMAQRLGQSRWYDSYHVRVAKVEREYGS